MKGKGSLTTPTPLGGTVPDKSPIPLSLEGTRRLYREKKERRHIGKGFRVGEVGPVVMNYKSLRRFRKKRFL